MSDLAIRLEPGDWNLHDNVSRSVYLAVRSAGSAAYRVTTAAI
jgi:hypothetical protein